MKAKLVRTFTIKDGQNVKNFRLLTAGERSEGYVDYYILQKREAGDLEGEVKWTTIAQVKKGSDDAQWLLFQLLHGEEVSSEVPKSPFHERWEG